MGNLSELGFDARNVEPQTPFDVLPEGDYEVAIVSSERKATKDTRGRYVNLELVVLEGRFKGRKLFDKLNLWNQSEKAVEIARGTLSAICRAVNVLSPQDTSDLHNKPLVAKVVIKVDPTYGKKNEVRGYKPRTSVQAAMAETRQQLENPPKQAEEDSIPF